MSTATMTDNSREELSALDAKRTALEKEAEVIKLQLTSPTGDDGKGPPMGIDTPLVDSDGYPRADIDLYLARSLRGRLAQIRTDHEQIMKAMERRVLESGGGDNQMNEEQARREPKPKPKFDPATGKWVVKNWDGTISGAGEEYGDRSRTFDSIGDSTATGVAAVPSYGLSTREQPQGQPSERTAAIAVPTSREQELEATTPQAPFAQVDAVASESPAALAGLKENDLILQFGTITKESCAMKGSDPFQEVAKLVPEAAGEQQSITIVVRRSPENEQGSTSSSISSIYSLRLAPKPWNGRGLLGCHIVPVK